MKDKPHRLLRYLKPHDELMMQHNHRDTDLNLHVSGHNFVLELLEPKWMISGVTIITHGFSPFDSFPSWTIAMAEAVLDRADGSDTNRSTGSLFVHDQTVKQWRPPSDFSVGSNQWSDWTNSNRDDEEIVLAYDWSSDSNEFEDGWLEGAADLLFSSLLIPNDLLQGDLTGRSFTELALNDNTLDLHFIGHSRGAVLNTLVSQRFGNHFPGLSIEQVTTLDPHPAAQMNDPFIDPANPINSRLPTYSNVHFADNYYRVDPGGYQPLDLDFSGILVDGAFNDDLRPEIQEDDWSWLPDFLPDGFGYGLEHSDVHLWYHGTIDLANNISDGSHNISEQLRETWYAYDGDQQGFYHSRIAGANGRATLPITSTKATALQLGLDQLIFNGSFEFGNTGSDQIPGWQASEDGQFVHLENGRLHLGQNGNNFTHAKHNALFFPFSAKTLEFDYEVLVPSIDDLLEIQIGNSSPAGFSLASPGVHHESVLLTGFEGSTNTISLKIKSNGLIQSEILVDNIQFSLTPKNVQASDRAFPNQIRVSWDDLPGEEGYEIRRGDSDDPSMAEVIGSVGADVTVFDDPDVQPKNLYTYWTRAILDGPSGTVGGLSDPDYGFAAIVGDFNFDGVVDIADFGILASHFGSFMPYPEGNANQIGPVDIQDFAILAGTFGDSDQLDAKVETTNHSTFAEIDSTKTPQGQVNDKNSLPKAPPLVIPKYRSKLNPTKRHHSTGPTHDQGEAVISWYASNFVNRYVHKGLVQRQWPAREGFSKRAEDQTPETHDRVSNWTGLLD